MGSVEDITPVHPSWGFSLKKWLDIPFGSGSVTYYEGFLRQTGAWHIKLMAQSSTHSYRFQEQKNFYPGGTGVGKRHAQRTKAAAFLHRVAIGRGRRSGATKDILWLPTPLGDGICLFCGETDPFVFQWDHPFGWRYDEDFVITVCADCHRLKTSRYFWLVEKRIEKWLSDSNYS